jgi:hypothetical protein
MEEFGSIQTRQQNNDVIVPIKDMEEFGSIQTRHRAYKDIINEMGADSVIVNELRLLMQYVGTIKHAVFLLS